MRGILDDIIEELNTIERTTKWDEQREQNVNQLLDKVDICKCSYNYGMTHLSTWNSLLDLDQVSSIISDSNFIVLGSSLGWLVFYTMLSSKPPKTALGIDLLKSQVNIAENIMSKYRVGNANFICRDALEYLQESYVPEIMDIVVVCSLCWPNLVRLQVFHLLSQKLLDGSLVVAYHEDGIQDIFSIKGICRSHFVLVSTIDAKFSWDSSGADNLFIYKKVTVVNDLDAYNENNIKEMMSEAAELDEEHSTLCNLFQ